MSRKGWLAALTTLGMSASLLATASVASATNDEYTPSEPNPTLAAQCGLDFGLVLDSSGSIGDSGIADLKEATDAFVDALVDTGSTVAVTSFATNSPGSGGVNLAPTALTSANLTDIKDSYSGLASSGWTNWQDGLLKMQDYFPPAQSWQPKLVVLITDGNPNTTNSSTPGEYPDGSPAAVNPAISIANAMKTDGVKMFGIAVGGSINLEPIKKISNDTAYNGSNFPTAGYVQTDDYSELAAQLKELAVDLCAPSLTITKLVKTPTTQGFEPADGWRFDTTVTIPDGTGNWVKPSVGAIAQNTPSTKSDATDNGGAVTFQWEPDGNIDTDPVIVEETLKDGYEQHPKLYCTFKNIIAGTEQDKQFTVDNSGEWDLGKIGPRDVVTCTAKNTLTKLNLKKVVETGSAQPGDFQLTATPVNAPGAPNYDHPGDYTTYEPIAGDVTYQLAETGPGNYSGSWTCTNGVVPNGLDQIVVPKGTKTRCTIANTRDLAELKLVKQVEGADPNSWILTAQAPAPEDDRNISTPGGSGQFEEVYAGTEYTLGETGPAGYTAGQWVCMAEEEPDPQLVGQINEGDKVTLEKGQRVTCTIVNTRDVGSLTIVKEFNAQTSGFAGTFDINYACVDGATPVKNGTVQLGNGQSQTITGLPTGTVCTVTEPTLPAPPAGWQFNPPTFTPGNQATVTTAGQAVTVTVTNSIAQVSPVVVNRICPIDPTLVKPKPKKVGNRVLVKKIKTRKSSCVLLKPVVLCRPLGANAAGETAFCRTKSTKRGRVKVNTKGYDAVRVTVVVRSRPKPGFEDRWKAKTWRKSWKLR